MDGAHDMGGTHGFGPIVPEPNEPMFHAELERRAFALTLAMARPGGWTIDMSRYARENRPPPDYLAKSYYELWLAGLEMLMQERGLVSAAEIDSGVAHSPAAGRPILRAGDVEAMLRKGAPTERPATRDARFKVGDRVRAKSLHTSGHTRLPRYVRGRIGEVALIHGSHVLADASAEGRGDAEWLYTVTFAGPELWGKHTDPTVSVSVDAWESYLDAAP